MLRIACVLKSGPEYGPSHVIALRDGVARHLSMPHRFVCLTDTPHELEKAGVETERLEQNWRGWFSKIELFRPKFAEYTCYFDLDTIICGPLDDIVLGHKFTMLENFWRADRVGSGMMAWNADLSAIYSEFLRAPVAYMREYSVPEKWGDQAFILKHTPIQPERFQTKFPGKVVSYKMHVQGKGIPASASVICFHGQPRPWTTPLWKAKL